MTRKELVQKAFNVGTELVPENVHYEQVLDMYTISVLLHDLGMFGDVTSLALINKDQKATARIVAKSSGILCGCQEINRLLSNTLLRGIEVLNRKKDGDFIKPGDVILEMQGYARSLLAVERICLNVLMRMSGVATFTKKMTEIAGLNVLLVPTRKTLWGLLDKRACYIGGGGTHRLNLHDAILIKDNHLNLLNHDTEMALKLASKSEYKPRFIEVEVETALMAHAAENAFRKLKLDVPTIIMFDNMLPDAICKVLKELGKTDTLFEASGGINEGNLKAYAKTGVDVISMGALTINANALDFSMEINLP